MTECQYKKINENNKLVNCNRHKFGIIFYEIRNKTQL